MFHSTGTISGYVFSCFKIHSFDRFSLLARDPSASLSGGLVLVKFRLVTQLHQAVDSLAL